MSASTMSPLTLRHYREHRREGMPARAAMHNARAWERGNELMGDADNDREINNDWRILNRWTIEVGPGCRVVVHQYHDEECICRDDDNLDDDEELPEHSHFGIAATATLDGRETFQESCWGFVYDWTGQSNEIELAYAWDDIAQGVIDQTRADYALLSDYARSVLAMRAYDDGMVTA